jgi:hypothetical protein
MADYEACLHWDEKGWRTWAETRDIPYVPPLGDAVIKDSSQWNLSNYSLQQFLSLAREYDNFWKDQRKSK